MRKTWEGFLQRNRLHILLIAFLGLVVYSNTFDAPFQYDDVMFVEYRGLVLQAASAISELQADKAASDVVSLPMETLKGPWASRPLLYATFVLNQLIGGFNTWGYHAVNIALHLVNGVLLYFLVLMTGKHIGREDRDTVPVALLSSLIFVLHPVQTETVTMIVNRSMLMATTFYLAGLMLFLKIATSEGRRKKIYTAGLVVAAILGAASREDFATFPLMLLAYDLFFISRFRLREMAAHYRGYIAVVPGIALMGYLVIGNTYDRLSNFSNAMLPEDALIEPFRYILTQFKVHWTYIRLLLLPLNQNLDYTYPLSKSLTDSSTLLSFAGYAGLWAIGLLHAKKRPAASFGILWFLVILLPISFGIALMGLRIGDPIFEHRLYLPSAGLIVLAAMALGRLGHMRRALVAVSVTMCIALGGAAYARNYVWKDDGRLWEDVVSKSPNSASAQNNLGAYFVNQRRYDEGIKHLEKAIKLWPGNSNAYFNLGNAYLFKGDTDSAIKHFKTAIELTPSNSDMHESLGIAYMAKKQYEKALEQFLAASSLALWDADPLNKAARASYALGRKDEAIKHYTASLLRCRQQPVVLHNISVLYIETEQTDLAIKNLRALLALVPTHLSGRMTIADLYLKEGRFLEAVLHLKEAAKLRPDRQDIQKALSEAYSALSNDPTAVEQATRKLDELGPEAPQE